MRRIQPTVTSSTPLTDTSTAQIRIAPTAINSRLTPMPIGAPFACGRPRFSLQLCVLISGLDRLQLSQLNLWSQAARLARLEAARADLERRGGARPDGGDRLERGRGRVEATRAPLLARQPVGAGAVRDQHASRTLLGDRVERHQEVGLVVQLLANEAFGLVLVG